MYKRKSRFRPLPVLLILLMLTSGFIGVTTAKYVWETPVYGRVTFTARLADKLELSESPATLGANGEYTLNTDETVYENPYILIPGTELPKNPSITIVNKTPVEAYLFVLVTDKTGDVIQWQEDTNLWTRVTGANVGTDQVLLVHKTVLTHETCPKDPIPILKDNKITVTQHLKDAGMEQAEYLSFHAYLYEIYDTDGAYAAPVDVFNTIHPIT